MFLQNEAKMIQDKIVLVQKENLCALTIKKKNFIINFNCLVIILGLVKACYFSISYSKLSDISAYEKNCYEPIKSIAEKELTVSHQDFNFNEEIKKIELLTICETEKKLMKLEKTIELLNQCKNMTDRPSYKEIIRKRVAEKLTDAYVNGFKTGDKPSFSDISDNDKFSKMETNDKEEGVNLLYKIATLRLEQESEIFVLLKNKFEDIQVETEKTGIFQCKNIKSAIDICDENLKLLSEIIDTTKITLKIKLKTISDTYVEEDEMKKQIDILIISIVNKHVDILIENEDIINNLEKMHIEIDTSLNSCIMSAIYESTSLNFTLFDSVIQIVSHNFKFTLPKGFDNKIDFKTIYDRNINMIKHILDMNKSSKEIKLVFDDIIKQLQVILDTVTTYKCSICNKVHVFTGKKTNLKYKNLHFIAIIDCILYFQEHINIISDYLVFKQEKENNNATIPIYNPSQYKNCSKKTVFAEKIKILSEFNEKLNEKIEEYITFLKSKNIGEDPETSKEKFEKKLKETKKSIESFKISMSDEIKKSGILPTLLKETNN